MPTDTNRRSEPATDQTPTVYVLTRQDLLELAYGGGETGDTRTE